MIGGLGCKPEEKTCPKVFGTFKPEYYPLETNCEPIDPIYNLPIEDSRSGVATTTQNNYHREISTEVILRGCTLGMTQTVRNVDTLLTEQVIQSDHLSVDSENKLTGLVEVTKYDADKKPRCSGMYNAIFTLPMPVTVATEE